MKSVQLRALQPQVNRGIAKALLKLGHQSIVGGTSKRLVRESPNFGRSLETKRKTFQKTRNSRTGNNAPCDQIESLHKQTHIAIEGIIIKETRQTQRRRKRWKLHGVEKNLTIRYG
jgi:hypothetical protein